MKHYSLKHVILQDLNEPYARDKNEIASIEIKELKKGIDIIKQHESWKIKHHYHSEYEQEILKIELEIEKLKVK